MNFNIIIRVLCLNKLYYKFKVHVVFFFGLNSFISPGLFYTIATFFSAFLSLGEEQGRYVLFLVV